MGKRFVSLLLAMAMALTLAACGGGTEESGGEGTASDSGYPTYTWTAANVMSADSVYGIALHKFADLINEKSGGAITVEVFDAGTLGTERECLEGLQMGTVDFAVASTATCSNFTDSQVIFDLPYLFPDAETARVVLEGETCQSILDSLSDVSMKGLSYFENGIYAIISNDPIQSLEDMHGKRIRSIESNLQTDTYAALGATATAIAWGDCYTSLQTKVCDAISSTTIPNMYTAKFYEVGKYITRSNHGHSPGLFAMSHSLDSAMQDLIMECTEETREYQLDYIDEMLETQEADMAAQGVTFYDIDVEEWAAACQPIYDEYVGTGAGQIDPDLVSEIQAEIEALN